MKIWGIPLTNFVLNILCDNE